ncbi:unnamed protein product [Chrysodeixis includens]|uniref:Uncharacterized protein n=1 Tax=Chrysodeixis includens TaxID=689277 RepID=A0A9N8KVJ0_CHRIL|nr:unnamed protein product [Chrysodeixis includens]
MPKWYLVILVKNYKAVEVRQFDGNYFDHRVPSSNVGRPDSPDGAVPRYFIPPGPYDVGMVASPSPLGNAELPVGVIYKEYDERLRNFDRITGKDLSGSPSSPAYLIKKQRHRPRPNSYQADGPLLDNDRFNDRPPNYIQANQNMMETRYNYAEGPSAQSPYPKNKQNIQNKSYLDDIPLDEPIFGQCLNILSEKEKSLAAAAGPGDLYELRPDLNQYLFPRVIAQLARNNDFADLTVYRRQKNDRSHNQESNVLANSPDDNANDIDSV